MGSNGRKVASQCTSLLPCVGLPKAHSRPLQRLDQSTDQEGARYCLFSVNFINKLCFGGLDNVSDASLGSDTHVLAHSQRQRPDSPPVFRHGCPTDPAIDPYNLSLSLHSLFTLHRTRSTSTPVIFKSLPHLTNQLDIAALLRTVPNFIVAEHLQTIYFPHGDMYGSEAVVELGGGRSIANAVAVALDGRGVGAELIQVWVQEDQGCVDATLGIPSGLQELTWVLRRPSIKRQRLAPPTPSLSPAP